MRSIEATGKSVDAAIFNGLQQLGISIDEVNIEIIQTETKGLLGIGAKPAKVRLTEKPPEEVVVPDFEAERERDRERRERNDRRRERDQGAGSGRRGRNEKGDRSSGRGRYDREAGTGREERPRYAGRDERHQSVEGDGSETARNERTAAYAVEAEAASEALDRSGSPNDDKVGCGNPNNGYSDPEPGCREGRKGDFVRESEEKINYTEEDTADNPAADFVKGLIEHMGIEAKVLAAKQEGAVRLRIDSEVMGVLIGHRGETLDAIQYLTSLVINRNRKTDGYTRVTINTEDYREKREETLIKLAKRVAAQVKATGRARVLEPMNPYERRILHSALQNNPNVTTHSEGEEPNRRVVVTPRRRSGRRSNEAN